MTPGCDGTCGNRRNRGRECYRFRCRDRACARSGAAAISIGRGDRDGPGVWAKVSVRHMVRVTNVGGRVVGGKVWVRASVRTRARPRGKACVTGRAGARLRARGTDVVRFGPRARRRTAAIDIGHGGRDVP